MPMEIDDTIGRETLLNSTFRAVISIFFKKDAVLNFWPLFFEVGNPFNSSAPWGQRSQVCGDSILEEAWAFPCLSAQPLYVAA